MISTEAPGILQLADKLAVGMGVESVAYAKMSRSLNTYSENLGKYAQDQYAEGQKMIVVSKVLTVIQWVAAGIAAGSFLIGGVAAIAAEGASASLAATLNTAATGISQGLQGAVGAVQGGLQAYKSGLQGRTEIDSTAIAAFSKCSESEVSTIKNESQGAAKIGSAINTMLQNEGAIERQKIT